MFYACKSLTTINVDLFDMHQVTKASAMFQACSILENIYCGNTWNIATTDDMFYRCKKVKNYDYDRSGGNMANPTMG